MKPIFLRLVTRHLRGQRCTVSQIAITRIKLSRAVRAIAIIAGALILAAMAGALVVLTFSI